MKTWKVILAAVTFAMLAGPAAFAQEPGPGWAHGEVSIQGTGFFTKDTLDSGVSQHSTDTGGFVVGYRYHFNRWIAAEADYGWVENTQQNLTPAGPLNIRTNIHEATGALVVTLPHTNRIYPYLLAGGGGLIFDPTNSAAGALWQAKGAFLYGGGVDFAVARHVALRAEYRGFVYDRPDFGSPLLVSKVIANTAQPSAGIVFRF